MRKSSQSFRTIASFSVSVLFNLLAVVAGGFVWRGEFTVQVTTLLAVGGLLGIYLVWRAIQRACLPHSGFGWVITAGLVVTGLSTAFSPDPRLALSRLSLLAVYVLLFYVLLDGLESILDRQAVLHGALAVGWFVALLGVAEVYNVYKGWFQAVGSIQILPPGAYRLASILGHSNVLMPYINLLAPLALIALVKARRPAGRVIYLAWLLFYLIVLPFSSSRGGWFGFIAWVGVLVIFWVWRAGLRRVADLLWFKRTWAIRLVWLPVLALGSYAGLRLWIYFSSNASHGSLGLFDNRIEFWQTAWALFLKHVWMGVGPGRFPYEYLAQNGHIPPAFWPLHAHSLPMEVLAEFGLLGFFVLIAAVGVFLWLAWRRLFGSHTAQFDWYTAAALAGIASLAVHALVEDPTKVVPAMGLLALLVAWVLLPPGAVLPRRDGGLYRRKVGFAVLLVPGAVLLGLSSWMVWTYQPMSAALPAAAQKDWARVAPAISVSAGRDPQFIYYQVEAGLAWAQLWRVNGDVSDLAKARAYFEKSVLLEPSASLLWADKAVLDWQAGDLKSAAYGFEQAARLAPNEPSFFLNKAAFEEDSGQAQAAYNDYQSALALAPSWAGHPFFDVTPVRQRVMRDWQSRHPSSAPQDSTYLAKARQALSTGDVATAKLQASRSAWVGEDLIAWQRVSGMIEEAKGDPDQAVPYYRGVVGLSMDDFLVSSSPFVDAFNIWMNDRNGLMLDLVPGFLQIQPDQGQAEMLLKLNAYYRKQGQCVEAAQAWEAMRRFRTAGALKPLDPPPACPAS